MDTVYFEMAMTEYEKSTGKKCILGVITTSELSALLLRAQQLKLEHRRKENG